MKIKHTLILSIILLMSVSLVKAQTINDRSLTTKNDTASNAKSQVISGLFNATSIGVLSGSSQNRQAAPFSFQSLLLYQFNEHIAAGAGLGIDFLEETYIPVVADLRYYLRGTRFSPFIFAQTDYSVPSSKKADQQIINNYYSIWPYPYPEPEEVKPRGGFLLNPGFGVRHMFHNEFGLEISFSYRYQRLNYEYNTDTRLEIDYSRLNIRIGILFQ